MRASMATIEVRIPAERGGVRPYAALTAAIAILIAEALGIFHGLSLIFGR